MSESKISEISNLFIGPVLYAGDICWYCDKELTEADLQEGIVMSVSRGQYGHISISPMHPNCYICKQVNLEFLSSSKPGLPFWKYIYEIVGKIIADK